MPMLNISSRREFLAAAASKNESVEVLVIDRNVEFQKLGLFGRWARTGEAICIASTVAILASVGVFLATGSSGAGAGSVVCLIVVLACMPHHARRVEQMLRGKEILNHDSPERNPRPLGL